MSRNPDRAVWTLRALGVSTGAVLVAIGGALAVRTLSAWQLVGLAAWLAAAVVLHDGVWTPLVIAVAKGMAKGRTRMARLRGPRA